MPRHVDATRCGSAPSNRPWKTRNPQPQEQPGIGPGRRIARSVKAAVRAGPEKIARPVCTAVFFVR